MNLDTPFTATETDLCELDQLAKQYRTDKCSESVTTLHPKGYTRQYALYLSHLRHTPVRLLEVGIGEGASLKMWEAYFPQGEIFGIDITPECRQFENSRTKVFIGDQGDRHFLRSVLDKIGGPLDVIVDDGSHRMSHHRLTFEELFPALKPGGVYVIEDLHTAYMAGYEGGYLARNSTIEYLKGFVDEMNGGAALIRQASRWQRLKLALLGRRASHTSSPLLQRVASVHFYPSIAFIFAK
jgi:SAM-dependent methyltransferase